MILQLIVSICHCMSRSVSLQLKNVQQLLPLRQAQQMDHRMLVKRRVVTPQL